MIKTEYISEQFSAIIDLIFMVDLCSNPNIKISNKYSHFMCIIYLFFEKFYEKLYLVMCCSI